MELRTDNVKWSLVGYEVERVYKKWKSVNEYVETGEKRVLHYSVNKLCSLCDTNDGQSFR